MADLVNHPPHYTAHPSGVECIELTELLPFALGNALKYLWRAGLKSGSAREDAAKAAWYLRRAAGQGGGAIHLEAAPGWRVLCNRVRATEPAGSLLSQLLCELSGRFPTRAALRSVAALCEAAAGQGEG